MVSEIGSASQLRGDAFLGGKEGAKVWDLRGDEVTLEGYERRGGGVARVVSAKFTISNLWQSYLRKITFS